MNLGTVEPFAKAQDDILTEAYGTPGHSYPMISYKPLQASSAFKLYAKSQGLDFETSNNVTKQLAKYEKALKHASADDKDSISVYDYVSPQYHKMLDESKKYQKIINAKSQAPCGYLIYGGDIKSEIGLIRCSTSDGNYVLTTVVDGMVAEKYKYLKNDLLKVDVWLAINEIFKKVGIPTPSINEMNELVESDQATWDIYAKGYTCGVNQCESDFGRNSCMEYKPKNMREMSAFVAALRPGFKTQLSTFLQRKYYTTGVKELDNLLQDSMKFMIYQESIMGYLGWLGIPQTETYAIIKKISKKKFTLEALEELKSKLAEGWMKQVGSMRGFEKTWAIVEASARYSFNASHSVSYAYDSVYGAYTKAHYPYEFYCTMLQMYTDKGDKDKVVAFKTEMKKAFGINEGAYKFRLDNRQFTIDKESHCINPSLSAIKGLGKTVADELYKIKDFDGDTFTSLILFIKSNTGIGLKTIEQLVKIDYFSEFGTSRKLLGILKAFEQLYDNTNKRFKKQIKKSSVKNLLVGENIIKKYCGKETPATYMMMDMLGMLTGLEKIKVTDFDAIHKASYQQQILHSVTVTDPEAAGVCVIGDVDDKKSTPIISAYSLKNSGYYSFKVPKKEFINHSLVEGDVIKLGNYMNKPKRRANENGNWVPIPHTNELWILDYQYLYKSDLRKDKTA